MKNIALKLHLLQFLIQLIEMIHHNSLNINIL